MSPSDPGSSATRRGPVDWRGWLVVAWVAVFGSLYVKMMVAAKSEAIAGALRPVADLARSFRVIR